MDHIKFSENFGGKLDRIEFTTIRVNDPLRYIVGKRYKIIYPDGEFEAMIVSSSVCRKLEDLDIEFIKADTGLDTKEQFIELMKNFYGDVAREHWVALTLRKVE